MILNHDWTFSGSGWYKNGERKSVMKDDEQYKRFGATDVLGWFQQKEEASFAAL